MADRSGAKNIADFGLPSVELSWTICANRPLALSIIESRLSFSACTASWITRVFRSSSCKKGTFVFRGTPTGSSKSSAGPERVGLSFVS